MALPPGWDARTASSTSEVMAVYPVLKVAWTVSTTQLARSALTTPNGIVKLTSVTVTKDSRGMLLLRLA